MNSKFSLKNTIKDISLYISAFVPMYFLILIKLIIEGAFGNLKINALFIIYLITLILLIIFGVFGLLYNTIFSRDISKNIIILSKKNITDRHFLGYFSLFVLFALQLNLSLVSSYVLYLLIIFLIGIVYIKNGLFFINPLLNILGYNFYDIVYCEEGSQAKVEAKFFYKGEIIENKQYKVIFKNRHFSFIDRK